MMKQKHLLGLENFPASDIDKIIETSFSFKEILDRPIKKVPSLQGKTIVNLFFENSTRTRISFELAQKRLSADTVNFSASSSSLKKGESFKDTVQNIEAMKIDAVVMRHPSPGSSVHLTKYIKSIVINAGDGTHEHPTQAILDMTPSLVLDGGRRAIGGQRPEIGHLRSINILRLATIVDVHRVLATTTGCVGVDRTITKMNHIISGQIMPHALILGQTPDVPQRHTPLVGVGHAYG